MSLWLSIGKLSVLFILHTLFQGGQFLFNMVFLGKIGEFLESCSHDPKLWKEYSKRALERAQSSFTWGRHCRLLTRLTKVYGFWRYSSSDKAK